MHQSLCKVFTAMTPRLNCLSTNKIDHNFVDQSHQQPECYTIHWRYTNHLTVKMTSAQVVEMSVDTPLNSASQDFNHPDDRTPLSNDMTPGIKPFKILNELFSDFIQYCELCNVLKNPIKCHLTSEFEKNLEQIIIAITGFIFHIMIIDEEFCISQKLLSALTTSSIWHCIILPFYHTQNHPIIIIVKLL